MFFMSSYKKSILENYFDMFYKLKARDRYVCGFSEYIMGVKGTVKINKGFVYT